MKTLESLLDLKINGDFPSIGVTIGNFDGVHVGHQKLISKIKAQCQSKGLEFVAVTFTPHPQKILCPGKERFLIYSYEQRRELLEKSGVDHLVELGFTRDFSTLSPEDFLKTYLLPYPKLRAVFLGYDFAFGANKQGGFDAVKNVCVPLGIEVEIQPRFEFNHQTVSSSIIREAILNGKMEDVSTILGRSFHLEGVVIKGEGRGKQIGFPTANIQVLSDLIVPHKGVYITRTAYKGMIYNSITNIGNNPTFKTGNGLHIETNLFDFDHDIYGEKLEIQFIKKIRDEKKFVTVNDLINQIKYDIILAKETLGRL